jgi:GDP-L-fucose synthase
MPTNLYGPGDSYHPENSHVIPALIRRFHEAKTVRAASVAIWGTGTPRREFLHVDDMAAACVHTMNLEHAIYASHTTAMQSHLNVGCGDDVTIGELAAAIARVVGYEGQIEFDTSKPDGAPRKLMDSSRLNNLGWHAKIELEPGLADAYRDFLHNSQRPTN